MSFLDDPKRYEIRVRNNIGLVTDYLLRSEVTDYRRLRLVVNLTLGALLCTSLYQIGWKNLNFGDFDMKYGLFIQIIIIGLTSFAFAVSPIFRCALFCVFIGAIGKNGQYPFTMIVMSTLHEGPISNIINNYEITSDMVVCHIELQSKIIANRVSLLTGPVEQTLEKFVAKGSRALKKIARETRDLIAPFLEIASEDDNDNDKIEEAQIENMEKIEIRKQQLVQMMEKELGRPLTAEDYNAKELLPNEELMYAVKSANKTPRWATMKSNMGRKIGRKITNKCNELFTLSNDKCTSLSSELVKKCEDNIFWPVSTFICPKLNLETICRATERRVASTETCSGMLEDLEFDTSLENDIQDVMNLTKELDENSNIEMRSVRVETPRVEIEYRLSDMKIQIRSAKSKIKSILGVSKQLFQAFFIYFVYTIFRDALGMIRKYNNDVEFNNCYITKDFWLIDQARSESSMTHLSKFTKREKVEWKIMELFSFPSKAERSTAVKPFFKWFTLVLTVFLLTIVDYYFYSFLLSVIESARQNIQHRVSTNAGLKVTGEGVIAEFLKEMTKNQTVEIDQTLSNDHCLVKPTPPNLRILIFWLIIPLILSFFFQVVFSFAVRRVIVNYFLPYMFPKKSRVRLIYLYNKLLMNRERNRKECRARMRFMARRRLVDTQTNSQFNNTSFLKRYLFHRIFKTGQCFYCKLKMYPHKLKFCANIKCKSSYCVDCIEDNFGECYTCQVIKGKVTDEKSKMLAPEANTTTHEKKFLTYDEMIQTNDEPTKVIVKPLK